MNETTLLVKRASTGKTLYQKFVLEGPVVYRQWGHIDGEAQESSNTYKTINLGKSNELTPEQAAKADYHRLIKRKIKEGCIIVDSLSNLPDLNKESEIDLANIPTAFCCSKPTAKITPTQLNKLIKSGNARFFIKYNGLCHYILINPTGEIKLFTRRWDDHTRKYPHIVDAVKKLSLPKGTLLIAEFVIDPTEKLPHMEAFALMSSISKSDTKAGVCKEKMPKTFAYQEKHTVKAAVFGILFYDGRKFWDKPYYEVLEKMRIKISAGSRNNMLFVPAEIPISSAAKAFELAKNNKTQIEGFIVWDVTKAMKVTMNGKPDRCAAWKVKAKGEKDVIAIGWEEGSGNLQGKIGSLKIGQYDPQGSWIDLGTVAGLKPNKGECDPENWSFPCVIEVEYDQIFPDTGKFQFGHYVKEHEDKRPEDVELLII